MKKQAGGIIKKPGLYFLDRGCFFPRSKEEHDNLNSKILNIEMKIEDFDAEKILEEVKKYSKRMERR